MNDLFLKAIERIAAALEKQNELMQQVLDQSASEVVLVTGTLPSSEPPKDEGGN